MGVLAHETSTKYVQIKEVNMDQIECQVLGEVSMIAECAFRIFHCDLHSLISVTVSAAEEGLVLLR